MVQVKPCVSALQGEAPGNQGTDTEVGGRQPGAEGLAPATVVTPPTTCDQLAGKVVGLVALKPLAWLNERVEKSRSVPNIGSCLRQLKPP